MSNFSYWEQDAFLAPADVVIAGAGLAGLWSAYFLKLAHPSLKIILTDKDVVPRGASTRNAGFACFGSLTELIADLDLMGLDNMRRLVKMRFEGLERLKEIIDPSEIDYEELGGYELITKDQFDTGGDLEDSIAKINDILLATLSHEAVFSLADHQLPGFGFRQTAHLVNNRFEGQLHPGKLVDTLLMRLRTLGVRLLLGVEILGFKREGHAIRIKTSLEQDLTAAQLLICANTFAAALSHELQTVPARGQVLLTAPIPNLKVKGSFHFDGGFYYFRNLGDRILLGGARNKAFEAENTIELITSDAIQTELERFLRTVILPDNDVEIEQRWSGIMGVTEDRFPVVRQLEPGVYCAVGMGGIGIAIAPVVGEEVARLMR